MAVGGLTPNEANAVWDAYRHIMADAGVSQEIRSSWRKGVGQMPVLQVKVMMEREDRPPNSISRS